MCREREADLNQIVSSTLKEADDFVGFLRLLTLLMRAAHLQIAATSEWLSSRQLPRGFHPRICELDDIAVKRSQIGYAGSDCWDVEVSFFNAANQFDTIPVVTQTIDVNDTISALTDKPRKFRRR